MHLNPNVKPFFNSFIYLAANYKFTINFVFDLDFVNYEWKGLGPPYVLVFVIVFSLDPSYRRGRVYKLEFCLSVILYVITSTFPIWGLQIIAESC